MPTQVLDENLEEMLNETVGIEIAKADKDKYGTPDFNALANYPARLDYTVRSIRNAIGEEAVSTLQIYVLSLDAHTTEDRITLPAGRKPDHPVILSVEPIQDEDGQSMTLFYT